jgi:pimeloyl-ACP methyl ester carboxylesterase
MRNRTRYLTSRYVLLLVLLLAHFVGGCASTNRWVSLRQTPRNPLADTLGLLSLHGPKPTERTIQILRRYDLEENLHGDRILLISKLDQIDQSEPNREHVYALAELAYTGAQRADQAKDREQALELYSTAVVHAYRYLFDGNYQIASNPYDPQFRRACDLYNAALEGTLRIILARGGIKPGTSHIVQTASHECLLDIELHSSGWHKEDFDRYEFVSNYQINGLRNHYRNYGLGVPLIAIRKQHEGGDLREQYYPAELSFPITAFLRLKPAQVDRIERLSDQASASSSDPRQPTRKRLNAVLEMHDPLEHSSIDVAGLKVSLETDLSTPLAFFLSQPALDDSKVSTLGLLEPEKVLTGLYMLEPFRKNKIPVVMVHGLWSSPATWMEMFNDLRSDPLVRNNFQFWFYLYPSGEPFFLSAAQMRADLATMRKQLDPSRQFAALDQTVLVGHSMGGLVSKLQTVDSDNRFWDTLSEHPFTELKSEPEIKQVLAQTFFFDPNPSIQRVITIGTPHRGSDFSNDFTRWLGHKLIRIPHMIMHGRNELITRNPDYFRKGAPLHVNTSIDSLSPKSPLLPVLLDAPKGPWVQIHNIVGQRPRKGLSGLLVSTDGDGVVSLQSAKLENAVSQVIVPADHTSVHRHPQAILEVRRILLQHLDELRHFPYPNNPGDQGVRHAAIPAVVRETQSAHRPQPVALPLPAMTRK